MPASIPQLLHPILLPVLEEGFSPPPTSSPGVWTGRSRAGVTTYIQFFRHPGHHHFFIIFPTPFYIDFCSILAPNLVPKSFQNPLKIDPKSALENYQHFKRILNRIFVDLAPPRTLKVVLPSRREANFWDFGFQLLERLFIKFRAHFWMDFSGIFVPKSLQPGLQNLNKKYQFSLLLFYWFLLDFGLHLGSHFPPKSLKIPRRS